jgi:hypothetical protein
MDGAINSAAAQQGCVGGVNNGISWNFGYIFFEQGDFVHVTYNPQRQQS